MLRRLGINKKSLVIIPVALVLSLTWLFLPVKNVSIEPYGTLSLESKIVITIGYEAAYASPAAPVYQEFTDEATADALLVVVANPAGTSDGDLLIAGMTTDGDTSLTPPAGWTEISQGVSGTPAKVTSGSWWKIASSEPANYTFQVSASETIYIFILRITGAHPTAPIHVSASAADQTQYPQCPTVTTTVADTLVLRLFGADDCDITVNGGYPTGYNGITVNESLGSQQASGGAAWKEQVLAGDTTTASFTLTASEEWYATTIAVKPPAPDIANTPTSKDFGTVAESSTTETGLTYFTVTNNSVSNAVSITIGGSDMTGGNTWTLSNDGSAGNMIYGLNAGLEGGSYNVVVRRDSPYNQLVGSLAGGGTTQNWGLQLLAPSTFTDGVAKSGTVTLTATLL